MKAEELFIGALVRVNREGLSVKKGTIVEIRGIDADNKLVEKGIVGSALCRQMDDNQCGIWCEYLEPIPITPEILEKNGFALVEIGDNGPATPKKNYNRYERWECKTMWRDISIWFDRITKKWCLHGLNSVSISYIHELQDAFKFCRIEKEIVL